MQAKQQNTQGAILTLSERAYSLLKLWHETLPDKEKQADYYVSLHNKISHDDDSDLTTKEALILERLFTADPIDRSNLFQYFANFKAVKIEKHLTDKVKEALNKAKDIKFYEALENYQESKEDAWLLKDRLVRYEISEVLYKKLDKFDFEAADALAKKHEDAMNQKLYLKIKATYYVKFFAAKFKLFSEAFRLDKNQSEALLASKKFTLMSGRAATGKTQMLLAKIIYLCEQVHLKQDNILLLAFDKVAVNNLNYLATEALTQTNGAKYFQQPPTLTIDDLALTSKTLTNEAKNACLADMLEEMWQNNAEFKELLYRFLRDAETNISKLELKNLEAYYHYTKSTRRHTLHGERVRSIGEKWIADYLYEHGIKYQYGPTFDASIIKTDDEKLAHFLKLGKRIVEQDYYLPDHDYILEHWALDITEKDISQKIEFDKIFGMPWLTYKSNMEWKQQFWGPWRDNLSNDDPELLRIKKVKGLLETSVSDMKNGREEFEKHLEEVLKSVGITPVETDKSAIMADVWQRNHAYVTRLLQTFIEYIEHYYFDNYKVFSGKIEAFSDKVRIYEFLKLGLLVYDKYLEKLSAEKLKDENQILHETLNAIKKGEFDQKIKKIQWILIDEFQDFSDLYQQIIKAIFERNVEIKLLAVGDNWQACQSLHGANTNSMDNFRILYPESDIFPLITNFRSTRKLIVASNHFMQRNKFKGGSAQVYKANNDLSVFTKDISENKGKSTWEKYLDQCFEIIKVNPEAMILLSHPFARADQFDLDQFYYDLEALLIKEKVFTTNEAVHEHVFVDYPERLIGVEVDIVIMLEVITEVYPSINVDNELFQIFGVNVLLEQDNQKRLFYVAISRARQQLWLLTEKGLESEYFEAIK